MRAGNKRLDCRGRQRAQRELQRDEPERQREQRQSRRNEPELVGPRGSFREKDFS